LSLPPWPSLAFFPFVSGYLLFPFLLRGDPGEELADDDVVRFIAEE